MLKLESQVTYLQAVIDVDHHLSTRNHLANTSLSRESAQLDCLSQNQAAEIYLQLGEALGEIRSERLVLAARVIVGEIEESLNLSAEIHVALGIG